MSQFPDEQSTSGEFKRQEDAFRDWVKPMARLPINPSRGATTSMSRWRVRGPIALLFSQTERPRKYD